MQGQALTALPVMPMAMPVRAFSAQAAPKSFFDCGATKLDGTKVDSIRELVGAAKAVLVVNVASKWGVTERDYVQLAQMYKDLKGEGLEILAFPCNQFGAQEPEDAAWILDFVKQYPVDFHMMEKVDVQGDNEHQTYKALRDASELEGGELVWNFEKFLVNGEGKVVKHYRKEWDPKSIVPDIQALLKWA